MRLKLYLSIPNSYRQSPWQLFAGTRIVTSYFTKPNEKKAKKIPLAGQARGKDYGVFRWYLSRYNKSDLNP